MGLDKETNGKLTRFAAAFQGARERGANESDTVMFIVKFLEEVLGWDSLKGEISKEACINDRYCDIGLKIDGTLQVLVECKAASIKELSDKHIEQAENYASRAGICWVVLTNGVEWRLFHLTFGEGEGITHDLAFEANLVEEFGTVPEAFWEKMSLLSRDAVKEGSLDAFWAQKKALRPEALIRVLFSQDVLMAIRRALNRHAPVRLELQDVFAAVRDVLAKEALMEAGDITITKRRRRKRKVTKELAEQAAPIPGETASVAVASGAASVVAPVEHAASQAGGTSVSKA